MDERPVTIRIYPGELRPVYYTSVLAFRSTPTLEVIRLALQRLQIYEDKTLYELYEGRANEAKERWSLLEDSALPIAVQEHWKKNVSKDKEMRFHLKRKEHASLILADIVSQYISPEVHEGRIEDMCSLEELSEQTMLSNLRARFSNKHIYTYVGSILISVNPYYFYSIYNPKYTTLYQGKAFGQLPPHIFAIADNAYHSMLSDRENQTVIISGESGAGKTESTKFLLHHLMSLSAKMDETQSLELITLGTGPVLEAFGNARTVANNNSSRFGKFILVKFRENGGYYGASIEKYLLEKSRIISQAPEERNYHVFYYLLVGADGKLKRTLQLQNIDHYHYLTQGSSLAPPDGVEEYHRLRQALSMLSFSDEVQLRMFTVLSAILHIGNVTFRKKENEEAVQIQNMEAIKVISSLLQVEEETLRLALTTRRSQAGGTDFFVTPYKLEEAIATRDSMAKALYGALFDWIVDQVNESLAYSGAKGSHKGNSIGVLDIFGFEVFRKNSFEQFCINYANEQLQQYFNKHIFKLEQVEYAAEGIEWSSVSFVDNQECLDLIAKKPTGLLPLLDEECSFPGADDNSLFQKFERQHKSHPHYNSPQLKLREPQFTILHYASGVTYCIQGFREKNRDLMRQDIVDVLKTSHMDLVRALIGLPPYAVRRWHMAYFKMLAVFAFRRAGEYHRAKQLRKLTAFEFRRGSTPPAFDSHSSRTRNFSEQFTASLTLSNEKLSEESFSMERGGRLRAGLGIRTSRSYDLLTEAIHEECVGGKDTPSSPSSSQGKGKTPLALYGISPRLSRKFPPELPSPTGNQAGATKPQAQAKSQPPSEHPTFVVGEKEKPETLPRSDKKPVRREESRTRLPSISQLQEKFRKRWPLSFKVKESSERERASPKNWKSAPRVKVGVRVVDPRVLHTLARPTSGRHGPSKTVSGQFQVSLVSLMERLEKTNPFFIRCIKSNNHKAPCQFDDELVLRQLRYTGMVETVKIRKAGYSVRMTFEDFYDRYQFLMGPCSTDLPSQVHKFMLGLQFNTEDFQTGKTKVFMRDVQKQALQEELRDKVLAKIIMIQHWVRAKMMRCRLLHMRRSAIVVQAAVRGWLARRRVNALRKRICNAVLIQSAWRSYVARKRLILLKQAAIILQAHWKGRAARKRYVVILADHKRRLREEEERKEREKREREARERREREEREERERKEREEREERERKEREERERREREERERREREEREEYERRERAETLQREEERRAEELSEQQRLEALQVEERPSEGPQAAMSPGHVPSQPASKETSGSEIRKRDSIEVLLDAEISDVLFQFDTIVSELEKETDSQRDTPTDESLPQSPVTKQPDMTVQTEDDQSVESIQTKNEHSNEDIQTKIGHSDKDIQTEIGQSDEGIQTELEEQAGQKESTPEVHLGSEVPSDALSSEIVTEKPPSEEQKESLKVSVKELQQQFQTPSHTKRVSISAEVELPSSSGIVRNLIAQMQVINSSPSPPPPTSPVAIRPRIDSSVVRRRPPSPTIHRRISELTQGFEDFSEKRQSKIYEPPVVRRRIQSPFLETRKDEDEGKLPVRGDHKVMAMRSSVATEENHVTNRRTAQLDQLTPLEDHVTSPEDQEIPKENQVTTTEIPKDHVTSEQNYVNDAKEDVRKDHLTPEEDHVILKEDHVTPKEDHVTPKEDHEIVREDYVMSKESDVTLKGDHVTPKEEHVTSIEDRVNTEEKQVTVEERTNENELLNQLAGPPMVENESQQSLREPSIIESEVAEVKPSRTESVLREVPTASPEQSPPPTVNEEHLPSQDQPLSPPIVVSPPFQMTETPLPTDEPQVDQLAGLNPPEYYRHRSASDITQSTNVYALGMRYRGAAARGAAGRIKESVTSALATEFEECSTGDSVVVVPRERPEGEYFSSSLNRRKRTAVSIADPMHITGHLQLSPPPGFDESSEFTQGLTPDEIYRLNQHREIPSPSERLRLFSFTKRHLRLPFRLRGKKERDKRGSPSDKEVTSPPTPKMKKATLSLANVPDQKEGNKRQSRIAAERLLAHNFQPSPLAKFSSCEVCHKGFTGYMKHALKCMDCDVMVHRHCEERAPPCKAQIESGSYVTMSRKKVVKGLEDLDELAQFLLEKIALLHRDGSAGSLVDQVFKRALHEFHTSLVSSYSLSIQNSLESEDKKSSGTEEPAITITFSQLVNNFSNIFRGIAKQQGLNDPCHISIGINQIKTFLDEFGKARRVSSMVRTYSSGIKPVALRRKTLSGREVQMKVHKGHRFTAQQFKVTTVCEFCTIPIPLLEEGEVCQVCGYTCHAYCFKKTMKRCEGKARSRMGPVSRGVKPAEPSKSSSPFGVALQDLVPENTVKVPTILEKCLQHIEAHGLYTQGVYRKSAGASSKKSVRCALEEDPEGVDLQGFGVHAVASAVGTFFRELPEPLLTPELYEEFIRSMDITNKTEQLETLHGLISRLPEINHAVFERLVFHLARVAQHEHINRMTPNNLAIVFAPCLLRPESTEGQNPQEVLLDLQKQTLCLEAIITEQVEKLTATLRGIKTLTSVAMDTVSRLAQLIEENNKQSNPPFDLPAEPLMRRSSTRTRLADVKFQENSEERKRLTIELEEIERERVELTVNLPKLEPYIPSVPHTPSPSSSPPLSPDTPLIHVEDESVLPDLPFTPTLAPLTKDRVSRKPKRRLPSAEHRRQVVRLRSEPAFL